ncbi:PAN domain-containing protein [Mesorhizobium sp. Z1-4]|uniref:PAN domain-containing protein n=1 Tax=Mesorhizobium sp. Z1-4 TaxID=2448478 RepID=UPI0013DE9540|nr:PAN domain-containing protein [Mesorhizobium sp. Z1-4]
MTGYMMRGLACAAALFAGLAGSAQAQETVDLFTEEPSETARGRGLFDPVPGISSDIMGDVSYFSLSPDAGRNMRDGSRGGRRLRIALPEGDTATCSFPPEPDAVGDDQPKLLSGTVAGAQDAGRCDLVLQGNGVVGDLDTPSGRYRIIPVGDGDHAVVRIRTEGFEEEGEPRRVPDAARDESQRDARFLGQMCDRRVNASLPPRTFGPLRVMILYTPAAKAHSANIDADIRLMMAGLRRAYSAKSTGGNFSVLVELAHAQMVDYHEGDDMGVDLDRLSDPNDSVFGFVQRLRQTYRADFVHLLTRAKQGDGCGLGWLNADAQPRRAGWALSVSDVECAVNNYSFIHELGHNLGMEHDRHVVSDASPDGTNYGYVMVDRGLRSVMAYNNACSKQDTYCRRLPVFSSPHLHVDGMPFGRSSREQQGAYNIETLCRAAPIVAGYRNNSPFASYEGHDVIGREIARYQNMGLLGCSEACAGNPDCAAFTFDKWNAWCFLKGSVDELRIEPKAISGVGAYWSEPTRSSAPVEIVRYRGKAFPGRGYDTHRATSMEQCEQICQGDGHCMGFTFHKADNRCEAYASLGTYTGRNGADSGVKVQRALAGDQ